MLNKKSKIFLLAIFSFTLISLSPILASLDISQVKTKNSSINQVKDFQLEKINNVQPSASLDIRCTENPFIAKNIIAIGEKLGVTVVSGEPLLVGKDATYEALNGRLGKIVVSKRKMAPQVYCQLITHEFIHVLQHLKANLLRIEPMGWNVPFEALGRYGSVEEAEAYTYQNQASFVLWLLFQELDKEKS